MTPIGNRDEGELRASADQVQAFPEPILNPVELTPDVCAELLDPKSWASILALYARTMRLAVALVDPQGQLVSACYNPQPIWNLARESKPEWGPGCLFCLQPAGLCTAAADALKGAVALVHDQAGFAHIASPLTLGGQNLGMLLAGQVFDRFPEPMPLQRLAKDFGLSAQHVWRLAVQQAPTSRTQLMVYGELLGALGHAFLRERYSTILERRLAETNLRFQVLVDGVKDYAIFTVDAAGRVTSWNAGAERFLGYTETEILGRQFSMVFTPEDIKKGIPRKDLLTAASEGRATSDRWYRRKDGSQFFVSGVLAPVGPGNVCEFGMIMHNITDRLKAEAVMLQKQKLESLGVLAGGVAHDFNNLLTGILGHASLLSETTSPLDLSRSSLEAIIIAAERAATLTRQLLAYAGLGQFVVTKFDLSHLLTEMLPIVKAAIPKTIQLEVKMAPDLPWIEADAAQIKQIVMDLVMNAAEAIGAESGTLWVSTWLAAIEPGDESKPRFVCLEVRDSGCGMDEDTQARIFDPFFTSKFMGRGLGLAAVSGIVRAHKGTIRLESVLGEGSTFRISLPALGGPPGKPDAN